MLPNMRALPARQHKGDGPTPPLCVQTPSLPVEECVDMPVNWDVESLWPDMGQLRAARLLPLIPNQHNLWPQAHPQEKSSKFRFFNVPTGPTNAC